MGVGGSGVLSLLLVGCGVDLHCDSTSTRDLAARNCLVSDGPVVKVADLGLSREVSLGSTVEGDGDDGYYRATTQRALPLRWMAPEILTTGKFTRATDIWSFGCLVREVFFPAELPFDALENSQVMALLSSPTAPLSDLHVGVDSMYVCG